MGDFAMLQTWMRGLQHRLGECHTKGYCCCGLNEANAALASLEVEHKRLSASLEGVEVADKQLRTEGGARDDETLRDLVLRLRADSERLQAQADADRKALHEALSWAGEWPLGPLPKPSRAVAEAVRRLRGGTS